MPRSRSKTMSSGLRGSVSPGPRRRLGKCDWILESEAATMSYLQRHTHVPTPRIFDWACESDPRNSIGYGYILMEMLDEKPLDWQSASPAQREKVTQQLADIFLEIERPPFKAMGSLVCSGDEFQVRGLVNQATFRLGEGPLGPFSSSLEGARAVLTSYLDMIASGEIDGFSAVDAYLAHHFRLDVASSLFGNDTPAEQFFLKHPDDKGDHILVNESFNITGIIDWEWTATTSKAEAFSSPCMMWPVARFYDGDNELAADELRLAAILRERGRDDLAEFVTGGRCRGSSLHWDPRYLGSMRRPLAVSFPGCVGRLRPMTLDGRSGNARLSPRAEGREQLLLGLDWKELRSHKRGL